MKKMKYFLVLLIPVILIITGAIFMGKSEETTKKTIITGMVEARDIDVSSKIAGRISNIYFEEGATVIAGDLLASIKSKELEAKVGQAENLKNAAQAKYKMALNGARPEEKEAVEKLYNQSKYQFDLATKTWNRMQNLYNEQLISAQERDVYEFQFKAAEEQMMAAKAKLDLVLAGARPEEKEMAKSSFMQAESGVSEVLAYQEELSIKAPVSGELKKKIVDVGEITSAGYPIFTILDLSDVWITLQLKETMLEATKKGAIIKGKIPAFSNKEYEFEVFYISPMGEYANWRPTNQKSDFDIKTFEVRLRPKDKSLKLRPGMSVNFEM
ncbi:HlyD family secretion protein [Ignavibacteriales bacterium]